MIKLGKYQVCILDLVTDSKTHKLSTTKIWQHIGFTALTYSLLRSPASADGMLAYGAIVASSGVAMQFIKYRYRDTNTQQLDDPKSHRDLE